jgi:hypothetical protein
MEPWETQLHQDYAAGRLSEQGRQNYEADVKAGVLQAPSGMAQEAQAQIPQREVKTYVVPDDIFKRFVEGQMTNEGIIRLAQDMKEGKVVTPESEDVEVSLPEMFTGAERAVPSTEKLPSWVRMPEMNELSLKGAQTLLGTMAAGPDEISQIIKSQNPDVVVEKDAKGNIIFTSAKDGQKYAIKPGFRAEEDLLRGAGTVLLFAMGSRGRGIPKKMAGAAGTQLGIEATQEAAGGEFDEWEIPLAALFEGGGALAGKAIAGIKGVFQSKGAPKVVKKALKKFGIEPTQTAEEVAVETAEAAGVTPMTSDIYPPQTFAGKIGQTTTERIPVVGTGPRRVQEQAQRVQAIRNVLNDYGATETARASDDVMKDLLQKRGDDISKYTGLKNEVIEKLSDPAVMLGTGEVPVKNAAKAIDQEISRLQGLETKELGPLITALEDAKASFDGKNLSQLEDLRKILGEKLKSADLATVRDQAEKVNRRVYGALREDMGEFIKAVGERRDFNKWDVANKRLSGMMENLKVNALRTALKKGKDTPEAVRGLLFSRKPSEIRTLYKNLTPEGKARAKVAVYQEAVEKAGGIDDLSTAKFESALKKLEKTTGVVFRGKDKQVLDGLVKTLKLTKRAEGAAAAPPTGVQLAVWSAPTAASWLLGGNPVAGLAATGGIGLAARAYESKPVRNILIKIAKGKGDEQKYIKALVNYFRTRRQYNKED